MTTATLTLTDFLEQRIAEDEVVAREATEQVGDPAWQSAAADYEGIAVWSASAGNTYGLSDAVTDHIARHDPARVLEQCARHRAIMGEHPEATHIRVLGDDSTMEGLGRCETCADWLSGDWDGPGVVPFPCPTLRHLAAIYADHSDYREEWRP